MVLPATPDMFGTPAPPPARCGMDAHLGPFEPIDELVAFLGTDWFCCRSCRATITRGNTLPRRVAVA